MPRNLTDAQIKAIADKGGVVMMNYGSEFLDGDIYAEATRNRQSIKAEYLEVKARNGDATKLRAWLRETRKRFPVRRTAWTKIVDHLEHVMKVGGPQAAGLGSDFDGIDDLPTGMDDVSMLPKSPRSSCAAVTARRRCAACWAKTSCVSSPAWRPPPHRDAGATPRFATWMSRVTSQRRFTLGKYVFPHRDVWHVPCKDDGRTLRWGRWCPELRYARRTPRGVSGRRQVVVHGGRCLRHRSGGDACRPDQQLPRRNPAPPPHDVQAVHCRQCRTSSSSPRKICRASARSPSVPGETAYDPSVYGTMELRMDEAMKYIAEFRAKTGQRLTVSHLMAKAAAMVLKECPTPTRCCAGTSVYLRKRIGVFFQVVMTDEGHDKVDLSGATLYDVEQKSLLEICDEFEEKVDAGARAQGPGAGEDAQDLPRHPATSR